MRSQWEKQRLSKKKTYDDKGKEIIGYDDRGIPIYKEGGSKVKGEPNITEKLDHSDDVTKTSEDSEIVTDKKSNVTKNTTDIGNSNDETKTIHIVENGILPPGLEIVQIKFSQLSKIEGVQFWDEKELTPFTRSILYRFPIEGQSKRTRAIEDFAPVGVIAAYWGEKAPEGWLRCDGSPIPDLPEYKELRDLIGNNVPDLRGVFLRGLDAERGLDKGRQFGTYQEDDNKSHTHGMNPDGGHTHTMKEAGQHTHSLRSYKNSVGSEGRTPIYDRGWDGGDRTAPDGNHSHVINDVGAHTHAIQPAGMESHPKNVAIWYIIKY